MPKRSRQSVSTPPEAKQTILSGSSQSSHNVALETRNPDSWLDFKLWALNKAEGMEKDGRKRFLEKLTRLVAFYVNAPVEGEDAFWFQRELANHEPLTEAVEVKVDGKELFTTDPTNIVLQPGAAANVTVKVEDDPTLRFKSRRGRPRKSETKLDEIGGISKYLSMDVEASLEPPSLDLRPSN
jgi:hypothetical protein